MKRSAWVTGVVVAQFLGGTLFLGTCVVLLILMRRPEIRQGENAEAAIQGLKLAVEILAPLTVVVFVGAWSLWKGKLWGWWLALLTDAALLAIFVYSMFDDGLDNIDWDMLALTAAAFVLVVWLLIRPVRRFYWASADAEGPAKLDGAKAGM
jgi:uncharacterized membrane protein (DUF2068 family)